MKKKVLISLAALMTCASVGLAAPTVELNKGEVVAGYNYSNFSIDASSDGSRADLGKANNNGFYAQYGFDKNWSVGLETNKISKSWSEGADSASVDFKFTDATVQYAIDKNVNLIVGNRKYDLTLTVNGDSGSGGENKFLYGVSGKANLGQNIDGYATFLKTSYENQWQVGALYNFSKQAFLDVNYTHHKLSTSGDDLTLKGLGFGVGFRF